MSLQTIKEEIEHLSDAERRELADWLSEIEARSWETEIERDFSPGGAGMPFLEEMKADAQAGKFQPFQEGRRAQR